MVAQMPRLIQRLSILVGGFLRGPAILWPCYSLRGIVCLRATHPRVLNELAGPLPLYNVASTSPCIRPPTDAQGVLYPIRRTRTFHGSSARLVKHLFWKLNTGKTPALLRGRHLWLLVELAGVLALVNKGMCLIVCLPSRPSLSGACIAEPTCNGRQRMG
ncbi:hypothetical protein BJX64DRAFT_251069 [Aspergillus heterothallicus]